MGCGCGKKSKANVSRSRRLTKRGKARTVKPKRRKIKQL
jgi:hypothetical protein